MIQLKEKSIYGWLYKTFYVTDQLPKSLCSFFWKFIFAFVFCIPIFILRAPYYIFNNKASLYTKQEDPIIWIGIASYMIFIFILSFLNGFYRFITNWSLDLDHNFSDILFFSSMCAIIFVGAISSIFYFFDKTSKIKSKPIEITKEYIKGVKNKYCPSIKWI